jgi:hypothetical protein
MKISWPKLLASLTLSVLIVGSVYGHAHAATITVTNTNNSGSGSLRDAIQQANWTFATDTIEFNISGSGVQTINLTSPLDPIIFPIIIDGTTQPGFSSSPLVELNGTSAGSNALGLRITGGYSGGTTIRGLIINRFSSNGILIDASNVTIVGNYIGTNAAGTGAAPNGADGVGIFSGTSIAPADNNVIGGTNSSDRNLISGNSGNGVGITAQDGGQANDNVVSGNYIGTNAAGTGALGNTGDGILLNNAQGSGTMTGNDIGGTTGVTPGGPCTGACNLVSGNIANGIGLWRAGVSGTEVYGNFVGTNAAGTAAIANRNIGIEVNEAPNNTVGGTAAASRNVFSGNGGAGVFITGDAATGNVIQGNYIGTNAAGTVAVGNVKMGISIGPTNGPPPAVGASSNIIGGTSGTTPGSGCAGACNLISGNGENGILISDTTSDGNSILGNYIGTNAAGTAAIGNVTDGVGILNTPNTAIGNGTSAARNIISANGSNGVIIVGSVSTGNRVDNNTIGQHGLGNTKSGVAISGATDTAIMSNSIYFNGLRGIDLDNNGTANANDPSDVDSGANRIQNFPDVYAARTQGGSTKVGGLFNSRPNRSYVLQFFMSNQCDGGPPNSFGEAQTYMGQTEVTTDAYGNTSFGYTHPSLVTGKYITATATKKNGSTPAETSELSRCVYVNAPKPALTNGATWYMKYDLTSGPADKTFGYGFPAHLMMCAWDANQPGVKLPVVVNGSTWYLRASYTTGPADVSFSYGFSGATPVCGDWDGDGVDSPGVVSGSSTWYLRNSNSSGAAEATFQFGSSGHKPVPGDWDGNGTDTPGLVSSSNNWTVRNNNSAGAADASFNFGYTPGYPVVGDWDGNGTDTPGSVSTGGTWALRNSSSGGPADGSFQFGFPGTKPLVW